MNPNAIHHVYLALEPVDMRLGIDGLSSRIVQQLGKSPCDGRKRPSASPFCYFLVHA